MDPMAAVGLYERYVWSDSLTQEDAEAFKKRAEEGVTALLAELDEWIGTRERRASRSKAANLLADTREELVGLGVYIFERGNDNS